MPEPIISRDPELKRRRSTRIVQAVPLTVTGVDALGRPFQERTSTLIANCHGCRYQSKHYVLKNMWVTLEVPHPETGREPRRVRGKVVWIQRPRTVRELFQVGVELEIPGNIWGIAFPPADWFAFPETVPEIPAPAVEVPAEAQSEIPADEWLQLGSAPRENNLRVLPVPDESEASLTLARQVGRLVTEAKQQIQTAVREATAKAVEGETRPLLASLQTQLKEAAEKAVEAAAASYTDQVIFQVIGKIEEARQASTRTLREEWAHEMERRLLEAGQQLDTGLAQVEEARRTTFSRHLESALNETLAEAQKLQSEFAASIETADATLERCQKELAASAEAANLHVQGMLQGRTEEARASLDDLERTARVLSDEITAATTAAQSTWRAHLDADLGAASARWNEKVESSLESAARQTAERLARHSQSSAQQLEQELATRLGALRQSFEQATAEAESTLGTLRSALSKETARAKTSLAEFQQVAGRMEEFSRQLNAMTQASAAELERRFEAVLAAQSEELNRRAENAVAGMAQRLQPVLETAGQQTVGCLATQLEQQLAPRLNQAKEILEKLAAGQELVEERLLEHRQRMFEASEQTIHAALLRLHETTGRFEKDFQEAGRAATARWLADLEAKASETTHSTFESLFKSAEWYEKKVQTQMQAALDKGLELAAKNLRDKAGEISGLFGAELDHYSRSYVEHTQSQMDEASKEAVEQAHGRLLQAAQSTAAGFSSQAQQMTQQELGRFTTSLSNAFGQASQRLEAHVAQVVSKIDAESQQRYAEFHQGIAQHIQQGVAQARHELETQLAPVKEAWRAEREAQEHQFETTLSRLTQEAVESYKKRLENVSNSWIVTTVASLSKQSQDLIGNLAQSAEQRLRETCSQVFANVGEILRQRLLGISSDPAPSGPPQEKK